MTLPYLYKLHWFDEVVKRTLGLSYYPNSSNLIEMKRLPHLREMKKEKRDEPFPASERTWELLKCGLLLLASIIII